MRVYTAENPNTEFNPSLGLNFARHTFNANSANYSIVFTEEMVPDRRDDEPWDEYVADVRRDGRVIAWQLSLFVYPDGAIEQSLVRRPSLSQDLRECGLERGEPETEMIVEQLIVFVRTAAQRRREAAGREAWTAWTA